MAHDFKRFPELGNSQMDIYYWDSPHKQIFENFNGLVVKVIDGDTIRIKTNFRDFDFPVRMLGINAPELDEGGKESGDWLRNQILNEEVEIMINPKQRVGKFGRLLGDIIHIGRSMSQESLDLGFSVPFGSEE